MIEIRGLVKAFGSRLVLRGITLHISAGEFVTLVGPNGAGKTTLMRILATLSRPTAGQVLLGGCDLTQDPMRARHMIGLVSHRTLLYDDLSGEQNLLFYAQLYDVTRPKMRVEELLRQMGLWGRQRDPVSTYSRGMQQRLAIARALLHNPPILLLDEPDTGLDRHAAMTLGALLRQTDLGRRTVLMTTHNLEYAAAWGERAAILVNGRIVFQVNRSKIDLATLRAQYDHYASSA
ncbi:MAG: heme ABC exporter ATP-binding protein CcmA [Ardenticatenia bacterium]|jgi:heme exporter protein A|nr:MAG: heme ABC exporter ATP-binding protein CcmA [Ardenticatenia bacterium]